jgi:hypothetical protein
MARREVPEYPTQLWPPRWASRKITWLPLRIRLNWWSFPKLDTLWVVITGLKRSLDDGGIGVGERCDCLWGEGRRIGRSALLSIVTLVEWCSWRYSNKDLEWDGWTSMSSCWSNHNWSKVRVILVAFAAILGRWTTRMTYLCVDQHDICSYWWDYGLCIKVSS